jgi:RimJ/RimL family protein N-acetyltransferase
MIDAWEGFNEGAWQREINVRDFIQENYTPYHGDSSFLCGPTKDTISLWNEIMELKKKEIENGEQFGIQYWPVFELTSGELIGCCGLRPHAEKQYEIGFHLRPAFWGQGFAVEAATAVIHYAFKILQAESLFAGHNPRNEKSAKVLKKLGFSYVGDAFYEPTGLNHPSYLLKRPVQHGGNL